MQPRASVVCTTSVLLAVVVGCAHSATVRQTARPVNAVALHEGDEVEQPVKVNVGQQTREGVLVVRKPIDALIGAGTALLVTGGAVGLVALDWTATYRGSSKGTLGGNGASTLWMVLGPSILVGAIIPGLMMLGFGVHGAPEAVPKASAKLTPIFLRDGGGLAFEQTL